MTIATLLPALDRFLEAVARTYKDDVLAPIERKAERKLSAVFTLQGRLFLARLATMRRQFAEADPPSGWQDAATNAEVVTQGQMTEALREVSEDALMAGLTEAAITHGLIPPGTLPFGIGANVPAQIVGLFNLRNPRAVAYMEQHGAALVSGINETTRSQMRTLLTSAVDNGWSYDRTAREIRAKFAGFAGKAPQLHIDSRAHLIAVTESADAYEAGNMMVAQHLASTGIEVEKSWLAVHDDRTDEECDANDGTGWIPLDQAFPGGGGRPPLHPACRCTLMTRAVTVQP